MATLRSRPNECIGVVLPAHPPDLEEFPIEDEWVYPGAPAENGGGDGDDEGGGEEAVDSDDLDDPNYRPGHSRTLDIPRVRKRKSVNEPKDASPAKKSKRRATRSSRHAPEPPEELHGGAQGLADQGFLLVKPITGSVTSLQSVSQHDFYIMKMMVEGKIGSGGWDPEYIDRPADLRVSTWSGADAVLPEADCFVKLRFWQQLDPKTYALYFKYCNGGGLDELLDCYQANALPIPEHLVWHVAERLVTAWAYLRFGIQPGDEPHNRAKDWAVIQHSDLHIGNVWIHYPDRVGRAPTYGIESRAFPEIVLGDFGLSHIEGDIDFDEDAQWRDVYDIGCILRRMVQTHISADEDEEDELNLGDDLRPNKRRVDDANHHLDEPPYSEDLITALTEFEFEGMAGHNPHSGDEAPIPDEEWIVGEFLLQAREKVQEYKHPAAGLKKYYFTGMDVSWTKPQEFMPFKVNPNYLDEVDREGYEAEDDFGNPPEISSETENSMEPLRWLRAFHDRRPRYQFRSLLMGSGGVSRLTPVRRGCRGDL
ncbi:hypothetical protein BJ170DRAFT_692764 [Xylariales sp. AK1849]|nr:hypothetical protein BJ170DRAFT_692764 [Xylariales sp. AK1849]